MFVREKTARGQSYLYLVENQREGGRVRQRIIRARGRKDVLLASGEVDRLAASLVRHCDRAVMLSDMEAGRSAWIGIAKPLSLNHSSATSPMVFSAPSLIHAADSGG